MSNIILLFILGYIVFLILFFSNSPKVKAIGKIGLMFLSISIILPVVTMLFFLLTCSVLIKLGSG